ncbi:MAG TPA: hypothetical protein VL334_22480, partial [Anaerolineae bacterium]|nr:hypothetical protein [Anaerolineae bacterium]
GTQTITGVGSWTGTGTLTIGYDSSTVLANDVTMTFSDYLVNGSFSLDNHVLTLNPASTLNFTNWGVFDMGSQLLAFDAPGSATFTNHGTTSGSGVFQTSGTVSLYAGGTFSPPLRVVSGTTTATGTIQSTITVEAGATLKVPDGNSLTANGNVTVDGTLSGGNASSYFILNGVSLTNNGSSVTVANVYFASGAHTLQGTGSFSTNTATIQYGATVDLGSNHQMSTVMIDSGGTFNLNGYTLSLSGAGTPLTNNGTFDTTASTVVYNGTVPQTAATTNVDYASLGIDNAAGVTLSGPETVPGTLTLTNGRLFLGAHTLTLGDAATIGGTPSATAMVVADGNGYLRKTSAGPLTFTFPIGDVSGNYTPVALTCTTFPAGEAVDARVRDLQHPTMPGTTYLTRYWTLNSAATSAGCTGIFTYVQADVVGTESSLAPAKYNGVAWTLLGSGTVNVVDNTLTGTFESFSDFSGGEAVALAVNLASFAAEQTGNSIRVTWETVSETNNQGFNLYRSTAPESAGDLMAFVPSQAPGSTQGASYEWLDTEVEIGQTYWYWLEDIDLSGQTTLHGPVSVALLTPTAVSLTNLHADSTSGMPAASLGLAAILAIAVVGAALGMERRLTR